VVDAQGPVHVVVVEDEEDLRELLVFSLEVAKFEVRAAGSLAEARLLLAAERHADVLVADFGLPDGTGADLLELCADVRPRVCILLSGHDARDIPAAGFDVVLTKPVTPEKLVSEIRARFPER
jgi:DNA-binding response OmpR family regulator